MAALGNFNSFTTNTTADPTKVNENFNTVTSAFGTSGHSHDGTAGNGPKIDPANLKNAPFDASSGHTHTGATDDAPKLDEGSFNAFPCCRVYHSTTQALADSTETALSFDSERFDTDTMHDGSSNTSRITFTTAGKYLITGTVEFPSSTTGVRQAAIRLNGTTDIAVQCVPPVSGSATVVNVSTVYAMSAADYVELVAEQTSGASLTLPSTAAYTPEFAATWVSN